MAIYLGPIIAWVAFYFYTIFFSGLTSHDFLKLLIFGLVAATPITAQGLWERYAYARKRKREHRRVLERRKKYSDAAGLPLRTDLHIVGPPPFMHSVYRVLDELKEKSPRRYSEAVTYLPEAVFDSSLQLAGRADGRFSLDGSGHIDRGGGWYSRNDYDSFRHTFLHEVGHNVCGKQRDDWSEDAANGYAAMVTQELLWSSKG
jgi:hypothetical protein